MAKVQVIDPGIKYGGGSQEIRRLLKDTSELIAQVENLEQLPGQALANSLATDGEDFHSIKLGVLRMLENTIRSFSDIGGR